MYTLLDHLEGWLTDAATQGSEWLELPDDNNTVQFWKAQAQSRCHLHTCTITWRRGGEREDEMSKVSQVLTRVLF